MAATNMQKTLDYRYQIPIGGRSCSRNVYPFRKKYPFSFGNPSFGLIKCDFKTESNH